MAIDKDRLQEIKIERLREKLETAFKSYSHNVNRLEVLFGILFVSSLTIASAKEHSTLILIGIGFTLLAVSIFIYDLIVAFDTIFNERSKASQELDKILDNIEFANSFKTASGNNVITNRATNSKYRVISIGLFLVCGLAFILLG